MKTHIIFLVIGIVLVSLGFVQFWQYENNSITVEATITDIKTHEVNDDSTDRYRYTYYGDYTVDGKEYKNVKLKTEYSSEMYPDNHVGDKMELVVNAENPGRKMTEGGIFGTVGLVMVVWNAIAIAKVKKANKETAQ